MLSSSTVSLRCETRNIVFIQQLLVEVWVVKGGEKRSKVEKDIDLPLEGILLKFSSEYANVQRQKWASG